MKKYTKSDIMKAAWKMARIGQKRFGGKVREYFTAALKKAWEMVKKHVYVPAWFLEKKALFSCDTRCEIIRETEKAYLVVNRVNETTWVPKSIAEKVYSC